jgi:hypothetical protein
MSLFDYKLSREIAHTGSDRPDPPFYAIVMAAMRRADTQNLGQLKAAFPETYQEFEQRRAANFGLLAGEFCDRCNVRAIDTKHECRAEDLAAAQSDEDEP